MDQNPHRNRRLALSKMDQNGITPESTLALSNKIDASSGDGENEKQDRRLQRQAVAMAMAIARDIQTHSTRNPLIKLIQPKNNKKQRKKERSATAAAAAMVIDES